MSQSSLAVTRTKRVHTRKHKDPYAKYICPSDSKKESRSSGLDKSGFKYTRPKTSRNTSLHTSRSLEIEILHSNVELTARRGHNHKRGGRVHGRGKGGGGLVGGDGRGGFEGITWHTQRRSGPQGGRLAEGDIWIIRWGRKGIRGKMVGRLEGDNGWVIIIKWSRKRRRGTQGARIVEGDSGGSIRDRHGTPGHSSQMSEVEGKINKKNGNSLASSIIKQDPASSEGPNASMKKCSPLPQQTGSCRKTILSWLVDSKHIKEDEKVVYMDATKNNATTTGKITRGRIRCTCCTMEMSLWAFEKHAGSDLGQPYEHIYLSNKHKCLRHYQIFACEDARELKREFSYPPNETDADQNDDTCIICGDGGDIICCDECPSTYHPSCMNMKRIPRSKWFCPYCVCKYCGLGEKRKPLDTCCQCDKKFHRRCIKESGKEFSKETLDNDFSRLYCSPGCRQIYETLEGSLGIRNDVCATYSWSVIRQTDITPKVLSAATRSQQLEINSKVAVAWMLMNEAFQTITDRNTGINVVQCVVYSCGSNLSRINFSRFYTFVLEKDDEVIAAACIRFHGRRMAEMPFIATDEAYRGQGICQELMKAIESFLCNLKIEKFIIPSASMVYEMWKRKYGFDEMGEDLKREITSCNMLMFPGCLRLYKDISTCITDGDNDRKLKWIKTELTKPLLALNEEPHPEEY